MLRDYNGNSLKPLIEALQQFGVDTDKMSIIKYEALSPDSFIWFFGKYCLYAEDFVPSLDHAVKRINKNLPTNYDCAYELVEVQSPEEWADTSPVKSADTYPEPEDTKEFMRYASTSGYDFVFLAKIKES